MPSGPALAVIVSVTLAALGWMITLLYRGFKHASGLAGAGVVAGFIGIAVASEVASKVVLSIAPR